MKITRKLIATPFGEISLFRLVNSSGAAAELSSLGAGIVAVEVPDRDGRLENVALTYADPASYMADGPCMGKVPGRYANRIAEGRLKVEDKSYSLEINNGPNHLHGGSKGFQNHIWEAEELPDGVRFILRSPDGDGNYPGNLIATAEYHWNDDNVLTLILEAVSDAPTVVNLTNHAYWNLDGATAGSVLDHKMRLKASHWLPTDETLIPTGEIAPVENTPMDFSAPKTLGRDIKADFPALRYGKGYDNCWCVDDWKAGEMTENVVELSSDISGRRLSVSTDQPGVQIYTGNWLAGAPEGPSGYSYSDYDGVAIEAQGYPDAPNHPDFPSQSLMPGETYRRKILFRFSAD